MEPSEESASSDRSAAIDRQDGAGNERGVLGGEIDACIGNVEGLGQTAERHGCDEFCPVLGSVGQVAAIVLFLSFSANILFHSPRNVAYRAISPDTHLCAAGLTDGWDILAAYGNDERRVTQETRDTGWEQKFQCSLQRHVVPKYTTPSGKTQPLAYNLAFVELQEDGQPYVLMNENHESWTGHKHDEQPIGQLDALLKHFDQRDPQYVLVFIHGWRHDASIGDGNVGDLRVYAAHAARFLADRCDLGDGRYCKANVTADFIGWRGARSDELWLTRRFGVIGSWVADFTAVSHFSTESP